MGVTILGVTYMVFIRDILVWWGIAVWLWGGLPKVSLEPRRQGISSRPRRLAWAFWATAVVITGVAGQAIIGEASAFHPTFGAYPSRVEPQRIYRFQRILSCIQLSFPC